MVYPFSLSSQVSLTWSRDTLRVIVVSIILILVPSFQTVLGIPEVPFSLPIIISCSVRGMVTSVSINLPNINCAFVPRKKSSNPMLVHLIVLFYHNPHFSRQGRLRFLVRCLFCCNDSNLAIELLL